jgi:hypothetical protein
MPSADAVGSKEQLSLADARIHAWTIAVIVVAMRMKLPVPVVTTRPLLSGSIMVNMVRSAESAVLRPILVYAIMLNAKLSVQPNAVIIPVVERSSRGTRTEDGIASRRTHSEKMTSSMVRNEMEALVVS